jgi:hypothetical protein
VWSSASRKVTNANDLTRLHPEKFASSNSQID